MGKIAFIFPGQGSQYIGMGKDFYENVSESKAVYDLASEICGYSVPELCFEENDRINSTEYTQIAMLTTELAMLAALESKGLKCDMCGGLSLGEYGAVAAAKVMSVKNILNVVKNRGKFMQEAYPVGGAMAAVIGLDTEKIEKICEETEGIVTVANYNCPGQIVISGEAEAVNKAAETMKEQGARKCIPLNVSGPFHSELLKKAGDELSEVLRSVSIEDITVPYTANVTGEFVKDASEIKELLTKQVYSSVKWYQCVEAMIAEGADTFVEIGPGKTLAGFMKRINKAVKVYNVEKLEDVETVLNALTGGQNA